MAGRLKGAAKKITKGAGKKVKTGLKTARTAALAATGITGATAGLGSIGKGFTKGATFFGGKKDPNITPTTPMAGESAGEAVQEILQKILVDATAIRETLASKEVPEAEKKEIALDEEVRHDSLVKAILNWRKGDDEEEGEESLWDKIKRWTAWILNPKTWVKALAGTPIVVALLSFMTTVGAFLVGPAGIALVAVLAVAVNWPDIKETVREFVQKVKDYVQAILDVTGLSLLIDAFGDAEVDEFADFPVAPTETDDPVGDAQFEEREAFADPSVLEDQRDGNVFGSSEEADKFLDDVMQGKSTEKVTVGASVFGSSEAADAFLEDTKKVQPQTEITGTAGEGGVSMAIPTMAALSRSFQGSDKRMTGTQGEGGVSMQIPTMAALSRAFQAKEESEPLSEEEQFKKDAREKGASEEAIALAVRMKFRSEWERSLTPDEERKQAKMEEAGASEKAIKHSIQMDRSAREKGFKNQAEYLASIPEKGETKPALTYNEGWQINKGGGWEDVADQKVPTIMGEKGLSTLSHVRYRQKGTTQQSSSTSSNAASSLASSLKSVQKKDTDREQGTGGIQSSLSLISSFLPKATATVSGDGTSAQLTMQLAGAGRIGQKTIIINATTDSSTSFSTSSDNTEKHQKAMSINNNHTQPPQTGRDA